MGINGVFRAAAAGFAALGASLIFTPAVAGAGHNFSDKIFSDKIQGGFFGPSLADQGAIGIAPVLVAQQQNNRNNGATRNPRNGGDAARRNNANQNRSQPNNNRQQQNNNRRQPAANQNRQRQQNANRQQRNNNRAQQNRQQQNANRQQQNNNRAQQANNRQQQNNNRARQTAQRNDRRDDRYDDRRRDDRRYDRRDDRNDDRRYDRRDDRRYDRRNSRSVPYRTYRPPRTTYYAPPRNYSRPRVYGGKWYSHGRGPRHSHGYYCSHHRLFHYHPGYDPAGWLFVSFGWNFYTRSYIGDCRVVSKTFNSRGRRYRDVALLCYDAWGYPFIKNGSRRFYAYY